jgi:hypothetical protein
MSQPSTELDFRLQRLFARSTSALPDEPFLGQLIAKLESQRKARQWRRRFIWLAWAASLICVSPAVISMSLRFSEWTTAIVISPWSWVLSLPLGLWAMQRSSARA